MARKTRRRTRTPRGSGALVNVSLEALQAELHRRRRAGMPLLKRRARLAAKLAELDSQIERLGLAAGAEAPARARRGPSAAGAKRGRSGRRRGQVGLTDILHKVLTGRTLGVQEAAAEVLKAGYETGSKNFRTVINQTLLANKTRFRKVSRGQYTAK